MGVRSVAVALIALLVLLHAQIWFGRGSVSSVLHLRSKLATQVEHNTQARLQNQQLAAEVDDLRDGLESIEEKARMELGMIKPGEIFVQISP